MSLVLGTFFLSVSMYCVYALAFSTPVMVHLYSKARRGSKARPAHCPPLPD